MHPTDSPVSEQPDATIGTRLQQGAVGAAALSPFAGLIGRQKMRHDPLQGAQGVEYKDLRSLSRAAQTGDVLLTSKPSGSLFKSVITPAGGSQFYHAQPVTGTMDGHGYTLSAGDLAGQDIKPSQAKHWDTRIDKYFKQPSVQYSDAVLLRPKTPMTKEQIKALQTEYGKRVVRDYDNTKALSTFARELFVPKLDSLARLRPETVCEGNVCSTLPAMAHQEATGKRVVPGKASQDIFPTDFLRSSEYELVGSHVTPETRALEGTLRRKLAPWLLRAGLGTALGAGTYAATEDPSILAAAGGAYAGNKLLDTAFTSETLRDKLPERVLKHLPVDAYDKYPTLWEAAETALSTERNTPSGRALMSNLLKRRLPAIALAGGMGYGAGKLLEKGVEAAREYRSK